MVNIDELDPKPGEIQTFYVKFKTELQEGELTPPGLWGVSRIGQPTQYLYEYDEDDNIIAAEDITRDMAMKFIDQNDTIINDESSNEEEFEIIAKANKNIGSYGLWGSKRYTEAQILQEISRIKNDQNASMTKRRKANDVLNYHAEDILDYYDEYEPEDGYPEIYPEPDSELLKNYKYRGEKE